MEEQRIVVVFGTGFLVLVILLQVLVLSSFSADHAPVLPAVHGADRAATSPPADDVKAVPACPFCGMDRQKFAHSRVFVQYEDGSILGACSLHCAAVDMAVHIDKTPLAIWVGDYRTRQLVRAENAVWVMGGNKSGVMTRRAKWAFGGREGADEFILSEGGKIVAFEDAVKAAYEDMYEDTKMIREKRRMKRMTKQ